MINLVYYDMICIMCVSIQLLKRSQRHERTLITNTSEVKLTTSEEKSE